MPHGAGYEMALNTSTLKHLGIGMYSNVPDVLSGALMRLPG